MPSKYSRKNRDRKGGYHSSGLNNIMMVETYPKIRISLKKAAKKEMRRQHTRLLTEGLKDYEQEQESMSAWFWDMFEGNETLFFEPHIEEEPYSPFDERDYDPIDYDYFPSDDQTSTPR